jgi:SAM-dependent methyltransferase
MQPHHAGWRTRVAAALPDRLKDVLRPLARRVGLAEPVSSWWEADRPPWELRPRAAGATHACMICGWSGDAFLGGFHSEAAECPQCRSIARDRFLFWCFTTRGHPGRRARVLETSPRLGLEYREMMRRWFSYRASDFDLSHHVGDIQIDLQDIALPSASLDFVLTPHVLEHVPDTARALGELHRVVVPGGHVYLQVPLVYGCTTVPSVPEFHADNTPVFFNFGWDLTDQLRAAGFEVRVLVTAAYRQMLGAPTAPADTGDGFCLDQLHEHVRLGDLDVVADDATALRFGLLPAHHFATWQCVRKP